MQPWSQRRDCPTCPSGWGRALGSAFLIPGLLVSDVAVARRRTGLGMEVSAAPSPEFVGSLFPASCSSKRVSEGMLGSASLPEK